LPVDPDPLRTDRRDGGVLPSHRPITKQAITAARLGFQQTPIRAKRLTDRGGMDMKRAFHDNRTGPNAIHQFVFGNELSGRPGENFDDLEGATANRYRRTKDPQFAASKVDLALA
jgi:hypothetical protein